MTLRHLPPPHPKSLYRRRTFVYSCHNKVFSTWWVSYFPYQWCFTGITCMLKIHYYKFHYKKLTGIKCKHFRHWWYAYLKRQGINMANGLCWFSQTWNWKFLIIPIINIMDFNMSLWQHLSDQGSVPDPIYRAPGTVDFLFLRTRHKFCSFGWLVIRKRKKKDQLSILSPHSRSSKHNDFCLGREKPVLKTPLKVLDNRKPK